MNILSVEFFFIFDFHPDPILIGPGVLSVADNLPVDLNIWLIGLNDKLTMLYVLDYDGLSKDADDRKS